PRTGDERIILVVEEFKRRQTGANQQVVVAGTCQDPVRACAQRAQVFGIKRVECGGHGGLLAQRGETATAWWSVQAHYPSKRSVGPAPASAGAAAARTDRRESAILRIHSTGA